MIANTYLRLKEKYQRSDILVTVGCTSDPSLRERRYKNTNIFLDDSEIEQLPESPKHFTNFHYS
jgi:hypothetical protein